MHAPERLEQADTFGNLVLFSRKFHENELLVLTGEHDTHQTFAR